MATTTRPTPMSMATPGDRSEDTQVANEASPFVSQASGRSMP